MELTQLSAELEAHLKQNSFNAKQDFEHIYKKYDKPFEDAAEIDITDLSVVRNKGLLYKIKRTAIGKAKLKVGIASTVNVTFPHRDSALGCSTITHPSDRTILSEASTSAQHTTAVSQCNSPEDIKPNITLLSLTTDRLRGELNDAEPSDAETISSESATSDDEQTQGTEDSDSSQSTALTPSREEITCDSDSDHSGPSMVLSPRTVTVKRRRLVASRVPLKPSSMSKMTTAPRRIVTTLCDTDDTVPSSASSLDTRSHTEEVTLSRHSGWLKPPVAVENDVDQAIRGVNTNVTKPVHTTISGDVVNSHDKIRRLNETYTIECEYQFNADESSTQFQQLESGAAFTRLKSPSRGHTVNGLKEDCVTLSSTARSDCSEDRAISARDQFPLRSVTGKPKVKTLYRRSACDSSDDIKVHSSKLPANSLTQQQYCKHSEVRAESYVAQSVQVSGDTKESKVAVHCGNVSTPVGCVRLIPGSSTTGFVSLSNATGSQRNDVSSRSSLENAKKADKLFVQRDVRTIRFSDAGSRACPPGCVRLLPGSSYISLSATKAVRSVNISNDSDCEIVENVTTSDKLNSLITVSDVTELASKDTAMEQLTMLRRKNSAADSHVTEDCIKAAIEREWRMLHDVYINTNSAVVTPQRPTPLCSRTHKAPAECFAVLKRKFHRDATNVSFCAPPIPVRSVKRTLSLSKNVSLSKRENNSPIVLRKSAKSRKTSEVYRAVSSGFEPSVLPTVSCVDTATNLPREVIKCTNVKVGVSNDVLMQLNDLLPVMERDSAHVVSVTPLPSHQSRKPQVVLKSKHQPEKPKSLPYTSRKLGESRVFRASTPTKSSNAKLDISFMSVIAKVSPRREATGEKVDIEINANRQAGSRSDAKREIDSERVSRQSGYKIFQSKNKRQSRQSSPTFRHRSLKSNKCSPKSRKPSPESHKCSPQPRKSSPRSHKCSPKPRKCLPKSRECSLKSRECLPKSRMCSPKSRTCLPPSHQRTPFSSQQSPKSHRCTQVSQKHTQLEQRRECSSSDFLEKHCEMITDETRWYNIMRFLTDTTDPPEHAPNNSKSSENTGKDPGFVEASGFDTGLGTYFCDDVSTRVHNGHLDGCSSTRAHNANLTLRSFVCGRSSENECDNSTHSDYANHSSFARVHSADSSQSFVQEKDQNHSANVTICPGRGICTKTFCFTCLQ